MGGRKGGRKRGRKGDRKGGRKGGRKEEVDNLRGCDVGRGRRNRWNSGRFPGTNRAGSQRGILDRDPRPRSDPWHPAAAVPIPAPAAIPHSAPN